MRNMQWAGLRRGRFAKLEGYSQTLNLLFITYLQLNVYRQVPTQLKLF